MRRNLRREPHGNPQWHGHLLSIVPRAHQRPNAQSHRHDEPERLVQHHVPPFRFRVLLRRLLRREHEPDAPRHSHGHGPVERLRRGHARMHANKQNMFLERARELPARHDAPAKRQGSGRPPRPPRPSQRAARRAPNVRPASWPAPTPTRQPERGTCSSQQLLLTGHGERHKRD